MTMKSDLHGLFWNCRKSILNSLSELPEANSVKGITSQDVFRFLENPSCDHHIRIKESFIWINENKETDNLGNPTHPGKLPSVVQIGCYLKGMVNCVTNSKKLISFKDQKTRITSWRFQAVDKPFTEILRDDEKK